MTALRRSLPESVSKHVGGLVLLAALAVLVLMPLYRLQALAAEDGWAGYSKAADQPGIGRTIVTTIYLAGGSLIIALVLGTLLAWASTKLPPRWSWLRVFPVLPIVVPAVASITGWALLLSPRPGFLNGALRTLPWWDHLREGPVDVYTLPWIVILTGFGLTSFVYLFVSAGLANINAELIEASRTCGSSAVGAFIKVVLPLLRPVLIYGGAVALLLGLGQFTGPLLLGTNAGIRVLTTDMYFSVTQIPTDFQKAAAIGSPLLVFGIVVVVLQRVLLGDQTRFVTHGGKAFRAGGRPSKLAALLIAGYAAISILLPLGALVVVALSPFWQASIDVDAFTLDNFREVFGESRIVDAIKTSLWAALAAVAITLPLGFSVARLLLRRRHSRIVRAAVDFLVTMPLGIPAVVFGVGFLLAYTQEPFMLYGSKWVIILVYVTLMLPFATRMLLSSLIAMGDSYIEASRASGASSLRTTVQIVLPLTRPAAAGAAAMMFILLTHEFAASLLVRSPTTHVMGTILYDYWQNGSYPTVAAIALIMTAVTTVGVVVAVLLGGARILERL